MKNKTKWNNKKKFHMHNDDAIAKTEKFLKVKSLIFRNGNKILQRAII